MANRVRGGAKLDKFIKDARRAHSNRVKEAQVGFFRDARYPSGKPVALVAFFNEFGSPEHGIPERPFFRIAIRRAQPILRKMLRENINTRTMVVDERLGRMLAVKFSEVVADSIQDLRSPPNAPFTLARKEGRNPLIDTQVMIDSLGYILQYD